MPTECVVLLIIIITIYIVIAFFSMNKSNEIGIIVTEAQFQL